MKKPRLVCLGDLMLDVVVRAWAPLEPGSDVPGEVRLRAGGSAANSARAFAALGGAAVFIGAVGGDGIGRRLIAALRAEHVAVHAVAMPGATPRLAALVATAGERSFVTDRGVADHLRPADIKKAWLARADALHVPAYSLLRAPLSEAALSAMAAVRGGGGLISVDLASRAPLIAAGADNGLRAVRAAAPDILFANADEVAALVGRRGARRLLDIAPVVVVKQGAAGCHVVWRTSRGVATMGDVLEIAVATKPLAVTDTTGAGDAFDAGFLFALIGSGFVRGADGPSVAVVRRAAVSGHRAAARLLTARRPELVL